jgi:hypothetical protein
MVHFPFQKTISYFVKRHFLYRSNGWMFSEYFKKLYLCEDWTKYYLPIDVKGLTVLDIGAGCGETARFFLEHGAKKVICIESDDHCYSLLAKNSVGRPIECIHKMFTLSDLDREYDFIKMDIEGAEKILLLLPSKVKKPIALEIHGQELAQKFKEKGYTLCEVKNNDVKKNGWLCYAN